MNLVTRFLAARRDKLLMRLGCWLVIFSLVIGLMLPQQKAEALVAELSMTAVASLAAAYLGACGLSFVTQGMDKDALVSSVQRLIQEFLDTELGGMTIQDWLGAIWSPVVMAGKLILGRPLTNEFVGFAQWVAQKYGTQVGVNVVYSDRSITFADGSTYALSYFHNIDEAKANATYSPNIYQSNQYSLGTPIQFGSESAPTVIQMTSTRKLSLYVRGAFRYYKVDDGSWHSTFDTGVSPVTFLIGIGGGLTLAGVYPQGYLWVNDNGVISNYLLSPVELSSLLSDSSLSVDRHAKVFYLPNDIAALQGIALDVGAAATMGFDQVVQGVLEDVVAGTLEATMEAAGEAVVDPPVGEITDVDDLGLPALGQALTSRFPFSIPWDFFRAVRLLAAPAKAPRFEVDFMQPIEHRVGQWQGDTKVVLDFSEYDIIGQISRWTSTIGFCLMLAGATKRLIWTA